MFKELKRVILHVIKTENVTAVVTCEVTNVMNVKLDIMDSLNVLVSLFKLQLSIDTKNCFYL